MGRNEQPLSSNSSYLQGNLISQSARGRSFKLLIVVKCNSLLLITGLEKKKKFIPFLEASYANATEAENAIGSTRMCILMLTEIKE